MNGQQEASAMPTESDGMGDVSTSYTDVRYQARAPIVKRALNRLRNILIFDIRYPWVEHGREVHCQWSTIVGPRRRVKITLGDFVCIGSGCQFQADTEIGNKVLIAANVSFINRDDHRFDQMGKAMWDSDRGYRYTIAVEDDVWVGHGSIILSRTRIGRGSVVAAGSVVTRDVPRYSIVGGNPARVLRMRFTPEQVIEHERILIENGELNPHDRTVGWVSLQGQRLGSSLGHGMTDQETANLQRRDRGR